MTNYSRKNAKIFGETANPIGTDPDIGPEIGQFGSAKAGTYNGTNDIDVIQSLPAWSNGWVDAVTPSQQFPTLPERTAVDYVQSYQIAYLLQKGVAEWDSTTVYYTTSYCQHNGALYRSKIDNNTGNEPVANVSNDYWQFLGKDFLNTQQVTNCLLEVPNNINLELNNGVLTLKAGSKVIVPNGFEQDGVTPKFDEVTIENDIAIAYGTVINRLMLTYSAISNICTLTQDIQCYSGATAPSPASGSTRQTWYDTTNNIIKTRAGSGEWFTSISFPIAIINCVASNTFTIGQVFNGFGYIGSAVWADKGIKGLIPNGRNTDGSLINIEYTTENITVANTNPSSDRSHFLVMRESQPSIVIHGSDVFRYDPKQNYNFYYQQNVDTIYSGLIAGVLTFESGTITGFTINNALNINSMCDGQWIYTALTLANTVSISRSADQTYSLSSYLPNDGCNYEVLISGNVSVSTAGRFCNIYIYTDIAGTQVPIGLMGCSKTGGSYKAYSCGSTIVVVGAGHYVTVARGSSSNAEGTYTLRALGYRRLGTNA